jgi:thiamine biosynthesis lipoprotein
MVAACPVACARLSRGAVAAVLAALSLAACRVPLYRETRLSMSTAVTVLVSGGARPDWDALYGYADSEAALFDYRHPEGPVGRLSQGEQLVPPDEVTATLRTALKVAEASGGSFDPTILPLIRIWSFDTGGRLPAPGQIEEARRLVDFRRLEIRADGRAGLPPGFGLDLGGIAKGAVVDLLAGYLEQGGHRDYLIEAGGDILLSGLKQGGKQWVIGIRHPRKSQGFLGVVSLGERGKKLSIVTSGDYERYFIEDGVRYHHILDPATGYPARGLVSVTIVATTCTEADALATAVFVLGMDKGLALLARWPGAEGLLVAEREGRLEARTTSGFPLKAEALKLD